MQYCYEKLIFDIDTATFPFKIWIESCDHCNEKNYSEGFEDGKNKEEHYYGK